MNINDALEIADEAGNAAPEILREALRVLAAAYRGDKASEERDIFLRSAGKSALWAASNVPKPENAPGA